MSLPVYLDVFSVLFNINQHEQFNQNSLGKHR
jgi:hypothetical protein